jgi:hypothetical protein
MARTGSFQRQALKNWLEEQDARLLEAAEALPDEPEKALAAVMAVHEAFTALIARAEG